MCQALLKQGIWGSPGPQLRPLAEYVFPRETSASFWCSQNYQVVQGQTGFVMGYQSGNLAQPSVILSGCGEVNEWWVLSGFACLPSHIVLIYLCMEIQAFLAGRVEKPCLVLLGHCTYLSLPGVGWGGGGSIWLHQYKRDILQAASTQSPQLVMDAQKQRDQEQGISLYKACLIQITEEGAGGPGPGRSWKGHPQS